MGSRETLLLALAIVSAFSFLSTTGATETADSWDMVLAHGNEIKFYKNDTEIRKSEVANVSRITALAYDSVNRVLYIGDGYDIRINLAEKGLNSELTFNRVLHTTSTPIWQMVFDPVTKTLFWVDNDALMKMEVASYGIYSAPKISYLHATEGTSPYHLTLDICDRFIYWTNHGDQGSIIERSRLDGADREVILTNDPSVHFIGLTVDPYGGKLYSGTSEQSYYGYFKIEESNLDGTDRRVVVNTDSNKPVPHHLAVDDTAMYYWVDGSEGEMIRKLYKNGTAIKAIKTPSSRVTFHGASNILTRHDVEGIDCKAVLDKEQIRTPEQLPAEGQVAAKLEQLSNKMDRLLTNQNQLLLALIGILEDSRLTHTTAISRIDALKPNLLDKVPHPEN